MEFTVTTRPVEKHSTPCAVVGVMERRRLSPSAQALDRASGGRLARLVKHSALEGKAGQTLLIHQLDGLASERVLLVGCGPSDGSTDATYRRAARAAMEALVSHGIRAAAVHLAEVAVGQRDAYWRVRQLVEAGHDAGYRFDQCKGESKRPPRATLQKLQLSLVDGDGRRRTNDAIRHGNAIGAGVALARDLGNLPANICTPAYLGERARALARRYDSLSARVRGEAEMKRLGLRTLLSVAQGSRQPPKLITLEHRGARAKSPPVVLVGKGVTFDSGGISLKPANAMDEMKFDMCGAASVLGALAAAAELELPLNVVGIVPATENLPGGNATKPGDVVTSLSGQTVEVLNTDAEGRLILCDALTFAERFEPAAVVDVATLTGACVVALGAHASGLFVNDDELGDSLLAAGSYSGDRAWQLPLWEDYGEALKSNFADLANVGGREAGAITGAYFLSRFATAYSWAHLDIAGTAWRSGKQKGATGRPVRLLAQFLLDRAAANARPARRTRER